jgi:hypothetical protein
MDSLNMTDKEIIEKIHGKLDGGLNADDLRHLENYLAGHPEAARISEELELIKLQMETARAEQVDIDLKPEILKRINMETYKQPPKKDGIVIVRSFWSRPAVRIGFTFVLGIFTGFMIFSFMQAGFRGSDAPESEMKGTMYNPGSFENMKTADVLQYESSVAKALCNVRYSDQIVELRVELSSTSPVKSTIGFDYSSFRVVNVQNVSVNDQSTAMAGSNMVQINSVGDNSFIIQLYNKNKLPHNIDFTIYQNDSPVYQNSVQVNKE